jgi:hypothetical protein
MPVIFLKLKPSRQMAISFFLLHGLSFFAVFLYSCPVVIKVLLTCLVFMQGVHSYRYYAALQSVKSIQGVEFNTRGEWLLHEMHSHQKAQLLADSFITQYLIILNFKTQKFLKSHVLLMRDSVSAEEWRKLRVYLTTH